MKTFQQLRARLRLTQRRFLISLIMPFLEFHEKISEFRALWAQISPVQRIGLVLWLVLHLFLSLPWVIQALIVCVPLMPLSFYMLPPQQRPAELDEQSLKQLYLIGAGGIVVYYALMLVIIPRIENHFFPQIAQEQQDQDR
jgi:hypothetical protein